MTASNETTRASLVERPRRLRLTPQLRKAVADVSLTPADFIYPLFLIEGKNERRPVASMPGVSQLTPDLAAEEIDRLASGGVMQFMLFGVTARDKKDPCGSMAHSATNPVNTTLALVRKRNSPVVLYTDLCFCEYTSHGHCGKLSENPAELVDNDATIALLASQAVTHAQCGADLVAPSANMDGMVGAIRSALDTEGLSNVGILSYAIKYASSFYGPFRDAGDGAPQFGDRRSYQMDYRRSREWLTELRQDIAQGADMVMVKPAHTYLDILAKTREECAVPLVAYHVSGEYSMIHAAAERGWIDLKSCALEASYAIKRAGADLIVSYFAPQMIDWLSDV